MLGDAAATVPLTTPGLWLTGIERGAHAGAAWRWHSAGWPAAACRGSTRASGRVRCQARGHCAARCWAPGRAAALLVTALVGPGLAAELARPAPPGLTSGGTAPIAAVELALFALAAILLRLRRSGPAALLLCGVVLAEGDQIASRGRRPGGRGVRHVLPPVPGRAVGRDAVLRAARGDRLARGPGSRPRDRPAVRDGCGVAVRGRAGRPASSRRSCWCRSGRVLTTTYGLFLVAKAAVVCVAAGLAVAGRRWLRRQPDTEAGLALATKLEVIALAVVIAITGILTVLTPPARASAVPSGSAHQAAALRGELRSREHRYDRAHDVR